MRQLAGAAASMLLLDYDGTLAPFQTERRQAYPYPRVIPILESILKCGRSRVAIITGRPIVEMGPLLSPLKNIEIWGSHGLEHLLANGTYCQMTIAPEIAALLSQAESLLIAAGLVHMTEIKPGGIAVHWRGLPDAEIERDQACAEKSLSTFAEQPELKLLKFEAGLELRVSHPNKGDAVTSILSGSEHKAPVAYLGDDLTDEDAFRVLNPHGLTVLVRLEYRETSARIWLRPPHELVSFLEQWLNSASA
jgi:trehalose 6-phosphate phosphatase